jgi:hypothetical protein
MFILVLGSILGLMHLYVWKRTVKDTTSPGRTRILLSAALVLLLVLLIAALVLPRTLGVTHTGWVAWPGYLWFGVVVYLFLLLLAGGAFWWLRMRKLRSLVVLVDEEAPAAEPPEKAQEGA